MGYDTKEYICAYFLDKVLKVLCTVINIMSNTLHRYMFCEFSF